MTSRERVMAVLNRQTPDRPPFEIGGTDCSSIHVLTYKKLRAQMGLEDKPVTCGCLAQLIAELDNDAMDALQVDVQVLPYGSNATRIWTTPFGVDMVVPEKFNPQPDTNGDMVLLRKDGASGYKMSADGYYFDPIGAPLAGATTATALNAFNDLFDRWDYSAVYDESLENYATRAKQLYASTDRAVSALWRPHYLQAGQIMRGYEQFFIDLMVDKDFAHALLQKLHAVYMKRFGTFLDVMADSFDFAFLTDDLGTQQAGLISPELYKEMIFPYTAELVRMIKDRGKKVVMHSCGAVAAFIPDLIDMGVDALNPVQVSAAGMNPADLVKEFGKDISFWGGGCDTQNVMNVHDTDGVRAEVRRRLDGFKGGSQIFTQVHNIQYDVSPENILAMKDEFFKNI